MSVLVNGTKGMSGSDINNLCMHAALSAVHSYLKAEKGNAAPADERSSCPYTITAADFEKAMTQVHPSVDEDMASLVELRRWDEQFGEGCRRSKAKLGFYSHPSPDPNPAHRSGSAKHPKTLANPERHVQRV